jgi:hypothetical protein
LTRRRRRADRGTTHSADRGAGPRIARSRTDECAATGADGAARQCAIDRPIAARSRGHCQRSKDDKGRSTQHVSLLFDPLAR